VEAVVRSGPRYCPFNSYLPAVPKLGQLNLVAKLYTNPFPGVRQSRDRFNVGLTTTKTQVAAPHGHLQRFVPINSCRKEFSHVPFIVPGTHITIGRETVRQAKTANI
jgi:hypothetical protein